MSRNAQYTLKLTEGFRGFLSVLEIEKFSTVNKLNYESNFMLEDSADPFLFFNGSTTLSESWPCLLFSSTLVGLAQLYFHFVKFISHSAFHLFLGRPTALLLSVLSQKAVFLSLCSYDMSCPSFAMWRTIISFPYRACNS